MIFVTTQVQSSGVHGSRLESDEDWTVWRYWGLRLARELTQKVYRLTKKPGFTKDYGLKRQIQDAAGSSMHNIAEGFDSGTNAEFIRFLRYAKRSCTEVQSELYVALDEEYISPNEFKDVLRTGQANTCRHSWIHQLSQEIWRTKVN